MKRPLIILSLVIMTMNLSAQIAGVNFSEAKTPRNDSEFEYEKLMKINEGWVIPFYSTPVGLKHCVEKMADLMELNSFDADNPSVKDVLMADYVEDLTDYASLATSLNAGSSEIKIGWDKNGYRVVMSMTQATVGIFIFKIKP